MSDEELIHSLNGKVDRLTAQLAEARKERDLCAAERDAAQRELVVAIAWRDAALATLERVRKWLAGFSRCPQCNWPPPDHYAHCRLNDILAPPAAGGPAPTLLDGDGDAAVQGRAPAHAKSRPATVQQPGTTREFDIRRGFEIAECHAEISEHNGWHRTDPAVDLDTARIKLEEAIAALPAGGAGQAPEQPTMRCPKCLREYPDFDGVGVLYYKPPEGCGYCLHDELADGVCTYCGVRVDDVDEPPTKALVDLFTDDPAPPPVHHVATPAKEIADYIEHFGGNYPLDIFPAPFEGCAPDLYAAGMARHLCKLFASKIRSGEAAEFVPPADWVPATAAEVLAAAAPTDPQVAILREALTALWDYCQELDVDWYEDSRTWTLAAQVDDALDGSAAREAAAKEPGK